MSPDYIAEPSAVIIPAPTRGAYRIFRFFGSFLADTGHSPEHKGGLSVSFVTVGIVPTVIILAEKILTNEHPLSHRGGFP
jgi:hypothetical protein